MASIQDGAERAEGGLKLVNRAAESNSQYVQSHKDDLVAWQLWDAKTLELVRSSGRLVFLTIGYASCHCTSFPLLVRAIGSQLRC